MAYCCRVLVKSHSTTLLVHDASVVIVALNIHLALLGKNAQELYAIFFSAYTYVVKSESLKNAYLL